MMGNGWGMGGMWLVWPLIILGIALVVLLLRRSATGAPGPGSGTTPPATSRSGRSRAQEILDERYARGELTDEEYQERLRHLRGGTDL